MVGLRRLRNSHQKLDEGQKKVGSLLTKYRTEMVVI